MVLDGRLAGLDEAPLDLAAVMRAVALRWVIVLALASVGVGAGVAHGLVTDATYRAQAVVLLPPAGADSRGNPVRDVATEVRLATGDDVLGDAGRRLSPLVAGADLRPRVDVDASTDDLLVIRAAAANATDAVAIADAVAAAYVDRSNQGATDQADASVASFETQSDALEDRLRRLNEEITGQVETLGALSELQPGGAEMVRVSAELTRLRSDAASVARQLVELNGRAADARLRAELQRQGTKVVDAADLPLRPSSPRRGREAALGGVAGLIIGIAVALVLGRMRSAAAQPTGRIAEGTSSAPRCPGHDPESPSGGEVDAAGGGRLVGVPVLIAAVHRRWRLCAVCAATGLLAGLALTTLEPLPFIAEATVIVGHPSGSDPARNIVTDVALARSAAVAEAAAERLGGQPSANALMASLRSDASSSELVRLEVAAPTPVQATRVVEAVAAAFVEFRRVQFDQQSAAVAKAIGQRLDSLTEELTTLLDRIGVLEGGDPATSPNVEGLSELDSQRVRLSSRITTLSQELEAASFDGEAVRARTGVVYSARLLDRPVLRTGAVNIGSAGVAGLALGLGWAVVAALTSDRVCSRDLVSQALGVPVATSASRGRRSRRRAMAMQAQARVVGHLAAVLAAPRPGGRRLLVLAVDRVGPPAAAVACLAREMVADGHRLLLADLATGGRLLELVGGTAPTTADDAVRSVTVILLGPSRFPPGGLPVLRSAADSVVVFSTLDPAEGAHHLTEWATTAVAVVTSGRSTFTWLRSVAEMVSEAGLVLDSAILLDADPRDRSLAHAGPHGPWTTAVVDLHAPGQSQPGNAIFAGPVRSQGRW